MRNIVIIIYISVVFLIMAFGIIGILHDNIKLKIIIHEKKKELFFKAGEEYGNMKITEVY